MKDKLIVIITAAMFAITGVTLPALAAGPDRLNKAGDKTMYPTWLFSSTKLCVRSLDPKHWGSVTVKVSDAAPEELGAGGGATNCIDRRWGGYGVHVTNSRQDMTIPVQVWTE
jgi:hypothetical protein